MKKAIILFCILFTSCSTYEKVPANMESISEKYKIEGSKNDLFVKANNWMVEIFKDSKSVIQFSDKEAGVVTGRYLFKDFGNKYVLGERVDFGQIYAIIKLQVKDGATKITIDAEDFTEIHSEANKDYRYTKEKANQEIKSIMNKYKEYLKTEDNSF
jgi:tRNA threonylcarbamoyladenosine modification (KEOPS) complex  Pcc1 subunit